LIYKDVELYNVEELLPTSDGGALSMTRIPNELRESLNDSAKLAALYPAGGEVRFNLQGDSAAVTLRAEGGPSVVEVFRGPFLFSWQVVKPGETRVEVGQLQSVEVLQTISRKHNLPFDPGLVRVILPYSHPVQLVGIEGQTSPPDASQVPRRRILAYGSSITHGSSAVRPTGTYAMRLAQSLGVDLINLGFGGGAHCEPQLADYIAGRSDWDLATLELGINMVYRPEFTVEEFKRRVAYFVSRIVEAHPDKWVFCTDMFTFAADLGANPARNAEFRRVVREVVRQVDSPRLVHLDGRRLLRSIPGLTVDLVHPSPQGMEEIAYRFSRIILRKIRSEPA